jgi:branched-chain amino acid transport system ATP-binding protein
MAERPAGSASAMLTLDDVHVAYGDSHVVQGVSLHVGEGEVVALLGRNGVGKTTLMRAISGLTPARSGGIRYRQEDITRLPAHLIAARGVRLVPQGRRLFPSLEVREHLVVGARPGPRGWNAARVLALFPRLRERLRHRGGKLSGGEQSMLATGRALVGNPELLLMDEPSEGLAPVLVQEMGRILGELRKAGASILLVEQNLTFALAVADRVYLMSKGRIVHEATPAALARDEATKARWLGV